EVLAAIGARQFSAKFLRAIDRTKKGGDTIGDRDLSGGLAGERTGRQEGRLRRHFARDYTKSIVGVKRCLRNKIDEGQNPGGIACDGSPRPRAREGARDG